MSKRPLYCMCTDICVGCLLALVFSTGCSDDSTVPSSLDSGLSDATGDFTRDSSWPDIYVDGALTDLPLIDAATQDSGAVDSPADTQIIPDGTLADQTVDLPADAAIEPSETCSQAPLVQLVQGKALLVGDTASFSDEFADLLCNATTSGSTLDGPQAYYRIAAQKDVWYKIVLAPSFDAYFYIFTSNSCSESDIQTDCSSNGATGMNSRSVPGGGKQAIYFKAPTAAGFYVGVDSIASWFNGPFELTVETFTPPGNGTCAGAQPLTFVGKEVTVTGDTGITITPDEFPNLTCDTDTMIGPQVYYTFTAQAGATYSIEVTADAAQFLHPFVAGHSCVMAEVSSDCSSGGSGGDYVSSSYGSGETSTLTFSPPQPGQYLIGVDSTQPFNYGGFTLKIIASP